MNLALSFATTVVVKSSINLRKAFVIKLWTWFYRLPLIKQLFLSHPAALSRLKSIKSFEIVLQRVPSYFGLSIDSFILPKHRYSHLHSCLIIMSTFPKVNSRLPCDWSMSFGRQTDLVRLVCLNLPSTLTLTSHYDGNGQCRWSSFQDYDHSWLSNAPGAFMVFACFPWFRYRRLTGRLSHIWQDSFISTAQSPGVWLFLILNSYQFDF